MPGWPLAAASRPHLSPHASSELPHPGDTSARAGTGGLAPACGAWCRGLVRAQGSSMDLPVRCAGRTGCARLASTRCGQGVPVQPAKVARVPPAPREAVLNAFPPEDPALPLTVLLWDPGPRAEWRREGALLSQLKLRGSCRLCPALWGTRATPGGRETPWETPVPLPAGGRPCAVPSGWETRAIPGGRPRGKPPMPFLVGGRPRTVAGGWLPLSSYLFFFLTSSIDYNLHAVKSIHLSCKFSSFCRGWEAESAPSVRLGPVCH